ncbi:Rho GTPase activation protein [Fomitiporia mediterranea MF3/22]|uniref:Rho GTPase activation protein n=1 Tax=Fomitiporia mediterranea (strain MF3/22) TaxID=694068 RepID=R7SHP1_FOMME|nr:Rho GTPase activation protein [Fomitiporia mediterranea MF3/22]EJC97797.1 Rho GTPase activation protein [Fomitiporia mediterranea MF3/22]
MDFDVEQDPPSPTYQQDCRRRNSVSVLPANTVVYSPSAVRHSPPGCESFLPSFPISFECQKDLDLETFRQARACGMTLDTISVAKPRSRPQSAALVDVHITRKDDLGDDLGSFLRSPDLHDTGCNEGTLAVSHSMPRSVVDYGGRNELVIPAVSPVPNSPSSPCFSATSGSPAFTAINLQPVKLAPSFSPDKQLARVNNLLRRYNHVFCGDGLSKHLASVTAEMLIDIEKLLDDHRADYQFEVDDRMECDDGDLSPLIDLGSLDRGGLMIGTDWRKPTAMREVIPPEHSVFRQPLSRTHRYASCVHTLAGYQNDLPIVVRACVEELYRTGMTVSGLFRTAPSRARLDKLTTTFDIGPSFGRSVSLRKENTEDICALLRKYITGLPHAIWHESLFEPMLDLCVRPSVLMEKALAEAVEGEDTRGMSPGRAAGITRPSSVILLSTPTLGEKKQKSPHLRSSSFHEALPFSNSVPSITLSAMAHADIDAIRERPRLALARAFFRLLPPSHLSLLVYLCSFFSQLPLCPHNELSIEDIAQMFAVPLFYSRPEDVNEDASWPVRKEDARMMMVWVLKRWTFISEGLFDVDDDMDLELELLNEDGESGLTSATPSDGSDGSRSAFSGFSYPGSSSSRSSVLMGPSTGGSGPRSGLGVDRIKTGRLKSRAGSGSPSHNDIDIQIWKSHVEKDLDELRRTLIEVQTRLGR